MRFSEHFGITRTQDDDWFDPHLTIDTALFVDPLLVLEGGHEWAAGHEELLQHFEECYRLIARSTSSTSLQSAAARRLLTFPEPAEFGLGYTASSTSGSGSNSAVANTLADGIAIAIAAGLTSPEHIEEVGIFVERIGADRISDAVCNVLKCRFVKYTQDVCRRHEIDMGKHRLRNARVSLEQARWITEEVELPTNPITGRPIILVPDRLLNPLPILNAGDWFDSDLNSDLRLQLNLAVGKRAAKADIVRFAREHPERVREWVREQADRSDLTGYDFSSDPLGVITWDREPVEFAADHPIEGVSPPTSQEELIGLISTVIDRFGHFIEEQRGWSLLWKENDKEKREEAAQLLFLGMAQSYLRLFDVELDREVELGRGPVDFKISSGSKFRMLIEVKKVHNGKFWNGVKDQLPSYLVSDDCIAGWYLAIQYRTSKSGDERIAELPRIAREVANSSGKQIRYSIIDARPKISASNINGEEVSSMDDETTLEDEEEFED
ncbi:hypothetical protein ACFWBG_24520 [Nocardia salmonicida]|uniref:hypothetical protein n=1 Tax=Nocardia salmonicida TaxID=53431 RepID=UPI00366CE57D